MRAREFLIEASLTPKELVKYQGRYLLNLIKKIENQEPLLVSGKYQEKFGKEVTLDPSMAEFLKRLFFPEGNPDLKKVSASDNLIPPADVPQSTRLKVLGADANIPLGGLEKTPDIKGKETDYNLGDIGEIAIAIATFSRFRNQGKEITTEDFFKAAQAMTVSYSKKGSAGIANAAGPVSWPAGKQDRIELRAVLPRRSMDFVNTENFLSGNISELDVMGTVKSAIVFANKNQKINAGIDTASKNLETNLIRITCDGVSDQRGTKADIIMDIDGRAINIVSAKVGRSQLGQASGHVFDKQITFFKTVFGVDVSKYTKDWGTTLEDHDRALKMIWDEVNPKIRAAFAGNVTRKEFPMVKQLAEGLIKYSNTEKPGDVDIVKLITSTSSPGYKLLRVDQKLYQALEKTDLIATTADKGVSIYGRYQGKNILLMKARSYLSQKGNTVRTVIEGGDLLDMLAEVADT